MSEEIEQTTPVSEDEEVDTLLQRVKLALRITTEAFDDEISDLIESAKLDLGIAGIDIPKDDALCNTAIVTYVKLHFGEPSDPDRLSTSYDNQKAQLQMATGYGME